jgi:hypothetical protein
VLTRSDERTGAPAVVWTLIAKGTLLNGSTGERRSVAPTVADVTCLNACYMPETGYLLGQITP